MSETVCNYSAQLNPCESLNGGAHSFGDLGLRV